MKRLIVVYLLLAACFVLVGHMKRQDVIQHAAEYCEMVQIYHDTDGDSGWPDYDGNFNEVCK